MLKACLRTKANPIMQTPNKAAMLIKILHEHLQFTCQDPDEHSLTAAAQEAVSDM